MNLNRRIGIGPSESNFIDTIRQKVLERARHDGVQITTLHEQTFNIILQQNDVIKAYNVLSQIQQQSEGMVASPTTYRALDFWAEQSVLRKVTVVNGYILCSRAQRGCDNHCHDHEEAEAHHSAPILVYTGRDTADEQTLSHEWTVPCISATESGFALKGEHVVLTGICRKCQK